ncbi:MAG TPA: hypothetical protein VG942_12355 [Hyphomonadaceae bacterium]|nr:hypothetical protein [Hyphomonadaceae bacterium]
MLAAMQEDDALIWTMYGGMNLRTKVRVLRTLRRQYMADLTDAEAEVMALKQRVQLIDNAIRDYMLGVKQGGWR